MEQRTEVFLWEPVEKKSMATDHLMNINHANLVPYVDSKCTGDVKDLCALIDIYGSKKQRKPYESRKVLYLKLLSSNPETNMVLRAGNS